MAIQISGSNIKFSGGLNFVVPPSAPVSAVATGYDPFTVDIAVTPGSNGGSDIISYTAVSSPGGLTGTLTQSGAGTITVSGLTPDTSYTFSVTATNSVGTGAAKTTNQITTASVVGDQVYTTPGTYSWVAPAGVYYVNALCVGGGGGGRSGWGYNGYYGGGGGGGALAYLNHYPVTPGQSYTVVVGASGLGDTSISGNDGTSGGDSYFVSSSICFAGGGKRPGVSEGVTGGGPGGTYTVSHSYGTYGGGNGGQGGNTGGNDMPGPGGGAGGYSGNGGAGNGSGQGADGSGGGGAGGTSVRSGLWTPSPSGGGGVGLYGQGSNGLASPTITSANQLIWGGGGGSGGNDGGHGRMGPGPTNAGIGGQFGGGGAAITGGPSKSGGTGAVRLVWGSGRSFPSTNVGTTPAATGGTTSTVGSYKYHKFTSSDTFTVTSPGSFDIVMAAGGGGAGWQSGGGGAGGIVYKVSYFLNTGTYALTIGAGGTWGTPTGVAGSNTTFDTILTALGGGGGGSLYGNNGADGGSGGGAGGGQAAKTGGARTQPNTTVNSYGFGEAGGNSPAGAATASQNLGAGGGGAMYGGGDSIYGPPNTGGAGGQGVALPGTILSDVSVGQLVSGTRYIGGGGGGYAGSTVAGNVTGTVGYGGSSSYNGGGGHGLNGSGGAGIIIVRYVG